MRENMPRHLAFLSALRGTRTPNLLIRSGINVWSSCPITSHGVANDLVKTHAFCGTTNIEGCLGTGWDAIVGSRVGSPFSTSSRSSRVVPF